MHKSIKWLPLFAATLLLVASFNGCQSNKSKKRVDVSGINVNIDIHRFGQMLFKIDTTRLIEEVKNLKSGYPKFFNCYFENIIPLKEADTPPDELAMRIGALLNYGGFRASYDSVMKEYPEVEFIEIGLEDGFRHVKYYFPGLPVPLVATFVSEFSFGAITCGDSILGIGLDMFLGEDFTFYPALNYPDFLLHRFSREYIVPSAMKAYNMQIFGEHAGGNDMLGQMVHEGKLLYLLDLFLPETEDYLKIGFTPAQIAWCRRHEDRIWGVFVEHELLYSSDRNEYMKYISPAPSSPGMPPESPGETGTWIGWQIVRKFMEENPDVTPAELMNDYDAANILSLSKYKPER